MAKQMVQQSGLSYIKHTKLADFISTCNHITVIDMHLLASRVVKLVLSSSIEASLHTRVLPQLLDDVSQLSGHCAFFN